ncbi:hypothetical protein K1T71_007100 [Dendrolimus kikuchii]|uniref:Uncharacterized protein n=1 Tax=Dendrolimus kikuchii TaxID=765133 RepID=A0ACC1CZH4_9NEOP|nr:hypothetical protein K1T71_007100 [Dendrolimus kikuchii]
METKRRKVQYLVTFYVSLGFVTLGMSSAWPTPVLVKLLNKETKVTITEGEVSWMLAMNPPGFIVGSFASRFLCDGMGRRPNILISAVPIAIGTIIVLTATSACWLYVSTFMWSCGTGIVCTVANIYLAEIVDKDIRGTTGVCTRFAFNFGNLIVIAIGPFISYEVLNGIMCVPLILYFVLSWRIPESPFYYMKEGKVDSARRAIIALRGHVDPSACEEELNSIQSQVKKEMSRSSTAWELFSGRRYRRAIIIAAGLKLTQIISGGVAIKQYFGTIMKEAHRGKDQEQEQGRIVFILFGAVIFIVGIMSSALVDRLGRRPLLIWSYVGTGLSLVIVGVYFFVINVVLTNGHYIAPGFVYIPLIGILLSNIISTMGFNSLVSVIPAEIFPLNIRLVAMASLNIFGGILGFSLAKGYQLVKDLGGLHTVFWIFSVVSFVGAVFSYFLIPETKGKDLAEIQKELQGSCYEVDEVKIDKGVTNDGTELVELKPKDVEAK